MSESLAPKAPTPSSEATAEVLPPGAAGNHQPSGHQFQNPPPSAAGNHLAPALSATRIKVPPLYEAIMRFLVTNPAATLQEGARHFRVSPGWYSTVINSDLFIARYQEFLSELDDKLGLPALADRVRGNTALAMERLASTLEITSDPEVILKASDILLKAVKPAQVVQNINGPVQQVFTLDSRLDAIQRARRQALDQAQGSSLPVSEIAEIAVRLPNDTVMLDRLVSGPPAPVVDLTPEFAKTKVHKPSLDDLLKEDK